MVKLEGLLKISVKSASGLRDEDWWGGHSDPYVQVLLDSTEIFSTSWKDGTGSPDWYESHTCLVNKSVTNLKFIVWDNDPGKLDDKLGSKVFSAWDVSRGTQSGWHSLTAGDGGSGGSIQLTVEFQKLSFDSHIY